MNNTNGSEVFFDRIVPFIGLLFFPILVVIAIWVKVKMPGGLDHYSFIKDIQMIICTVLEKKMKYAGEAICDCWI